MKYLVLTCITALSLGLINAQTDAYKIIDENYFYDVTHISSIDINDDGLTDLLCFSKHGITQFTNLDTTGLNYEQRVLITGDYRTFG
jgi:hypothetical protein